MGAPGGPRRALASVPVVLAGVVLISGVVGADAYGSNPGSASSSGFSRRSRTPASCSSCVPGAPISGAPPARSTGRRSPPLVTLPVGAALGELELEPTWPEHGWLLVLALTSQVVGWLLIAAALPRLPAALTSITLTLQPALSVIFAVILLDESPSAVQFTGVAVIIGGVVLATAGRRSRPYTEPELRDVAQPGSAPALGAGGRRFESGRPD